jgi:tetratricopeptide (TPR) repeat protein
MRRSSRNAVHKIGFALLTVLLAAATSRPTTEKTADPLTAGRQAYEKSDYEKAVQELRAAEAKDPKNSEVHVLLIKSYLELQQQDAAITSGERAIALDPKNSFYHEWLGKAYGEKASRSGMFSALGLAKKTEKELETAVQLDGSNFSARQALIEFDCSAPGIAGGGEDKAKPEIETLKSMDASEWHYAQGNCRRQKKDFAPADAEFKLALESHPKNASLIYDIGDYDVRRAHADELLEVARLGEAVAPADPRGKYYRAVGLVLKNEKLDDAERLLRDYLQKAPKRDGFPRYSLAHYWLGRLYEAKGAKDAAVKEYQAAVQLDPRDKNAREGLRRLGKT